MTSEQDSDVAMHCDNFTMPLTQLDDSVNSVDLGQAAKRLRTKLVSETLAQAAEYESHAADLRAEAGLTESMSDSQLLELYTKGMLTVETGRGDDSWQAATFENDLSENLAREPQPVLRDSSSAALGKAQAQADANFQCNLDRISDLLSVAEHITVSNEDSVDFESLATKAYEQSTKEAGLDQADIDARTEAIKEAARTGDFDIQGGQIGNAWARLPKDTPFKLQCQQV